MGSEMCIRDRVELRAKIHGLLSDLMQSDQHAPFDFKTMKGEVDYMDVLQARIVEWAQANGVADEPRYKGK